MLRTPVPRPRSVVLLGLVLLLGSALVAVAGPVEAARRPTPTGLRATAHETSLSVRWRAVRKAPGYRVRWSTLRSMAGSHRLAAATHRVTIANLTPDTRYFVQVAVARHKGRGHRLSHWSTKLVRRTAPPPCPTVGNLGDPTPVVPTGRPTDVRVATFNIRTINLDSALHPEERWLNRADRVATLLLGAGTTSNTATAAPDVIAVQEANQSYAEFPATRCTNQLIDLRNRLNAGGLHHYEATSLNPTVSVGTRILFDTARLRLESAGSTLLASPSTTHPHLAWAIFQSRDGGQEFFFGSVHLVPSEAADSNVVRDAEWDRLLALLADPALTRGLPVVLGGDFNSFRYSSNANTTARTHLPRMATAGIPDMLLGDLDPADPNLEVADARPAATPVNAHCMSFNGFKAERCGEDPTVIGQQIDYLFASTDVVVKTWEMVLDLDPLGSGNWLGTIPSDHNELRATVTLP
ncbi:endonuclease/exonuclease/phosphatase family metal-dependent hydrolase [Marmoricola sp. URHA0025 HA25]